MESITILTDPIPNVKDYYLERAKQKIRPYLRKIDRKKPLIKPQYSGHHAVTRSLIEGLKKNNIPFLYNPQRLEYIGKNVIVLAGIETLQQAVRLKKEGKIMRLFAGPNVMITPLDYEKLIDFDMVDRYIVNSAWTKQLYETDMPRLKNKLIIWPAGIDEEWWDYDKKGRANERNKIILYKKNLEIELYNEIYNYLLQQNWMINEVVYGKYKIDEYKALLEESFLLVHFVKSESQGLSLVEAWSLDVPTFVYDPGIFHYKGKAYKSSSAPYITQQTGFTFHGFAQFKELMFNRQYVSHNLSPRQWVINHMTDRICSLDLIRKLNLV